MIEQGKTESRAEYVMRVAAAYIRQHCPDMTIEYDGTSCDGYCIADDLDSARESIEDANVKAEGE
jgi:hypothetical protein